MRRFGAVLAFLVASSISPRVILADGWPRVSSGAKGGVCAEAFQIANRVFESDAVYLYAPPTIPPDFASAIVLRPIALDLSGGDALQADDEFFEKIPAGDTSASIYWQKQPRFGTRLVVHERPVGWRGNMYTLLAVAERTTPDNVLSDIEGRTQISRKVIADNWRPPLIFRNRQSNEVWVVDVGQSFDVMGDWRVYAQSAEGLVHQCSLQFRPHVRSVVSLLPKPVRTFASLLDQTMGLGTNEGTYQPTARLRAEVRHRWANAALRPWALPQLYNTRQEVDNGLADWSRKGKRYQAIYNQLRKQYPLAEEALARHYQERFGRAESEAKVAASYVLDIALRSHFTFQSNDPNRLSRKTTEPNPWYKK